MPKYFCSLLALLGVLAADAGYAQTIQAGVKAGIDFSSLPNAGEVIDQIVHLPSTETSSKTGVLFGGFVTYPLRQRMALQPELLFVMKGVKLRESKGRSSRLPAAWKRERRDSNPRPPA